MKRIFQSCYLLIFILLLLIPVAAEAQTLEEYQTQASQNNPGLHAAYNEYLAALRKVPQVSALPDPEIALAYFISPVETRLGPQRFRISATQMFPWFGSLGDLENKNLLYARAAFEQFQEQRNRIFYRMEVLWAELYEAQQQIRLANENLEIVNTLVNINLKKYETGLVPQVDVLRAQIEQEDIRTNIQLLEDNKELLVRRFNELRNTESFANIEPPDSLPVPLDEAGTDKDWLKKIHTHNPNLNALRFKEEAAETAIQIAGNNGKPAVGIGFDYIATAERDDIPSLTDNGKDAMVARLSLKIPLFRGKYRAEVQEASLKHSAAQNQITAGENQLEITLYTALRDLEDAERRFQLYDVHQIQRVRQAVNILLQSYASDNSQFEEILRLERKLFSYELERVRARADEFQAISFLRYLSGHQNISPEDFNF